MIFVTDLPEVRLETSPKALVSALEESESSVSLLCIADANPLPTIRWYKDNASIMVTSSIQKNVTSNSYNTTDLNNTLVKSQLHFEPIKKDDAGLYSCRAVNVIGESTPADFMLDVQCK